MSTQKEDDFVKSLRATFRVEAAEHLQTIAASLLALEKSPPPDAARTLVETAFRSAHSLKGAARAVDFTDIEAQCQSLEDIFAGWKRRPGGIRSDAIDKAHRIVDAINAAMALPTVAASLVTAGGAAGSSPHVEPPVTNTADSGRTIGAAETVRIDVAKLDAQLLAAEELLAAKLTTGQRAADLRDLRSWFETWRKRWTTVELAARTLRQAIDRSESSQINAPAPALLPLLEFLEWNLDHAKSLEGQVEGLTRTAERDRQSIGKLVDDLLDDSKKLLLLPFGVFAAQFPKMLRDLCRDQGKDADLVVHGEDVEIDKRILEELKAPLMHLLRNAVDHGIETPGVRQRLGKPSPATITIAASRVNGQQVQLLVSDDGAGIDHGRVKAAAVKQGLLAAAEAGRLEEAAALRLIFETEVSTSPMITKVSGRGLGLAIVRERTEKLGGTVSVTSRPGHGTDFALVVPSTLATFRGLLIEVAQRLFVVPTLHVERVARVSADAIRTVEGRTTVALGGRAVALVSLAEVLELSPGALAASSNRHLVVLVLGTGDHQVAFAVDAALDEQEVLVKPLRPPLARVRNVAGVTVLGSGQIAPVLNAADLVASASRTAGTATGARAADGPAAVNAKSILVAEDSVTSRMLIKGILESAGYRVRTAVNGMEAFALLRSETFDLVVSDVEMPRLNGFDLTARIRADARLAAMPVVLVTALESPEDRERGIDVGANAYIVKSKFDDSNLLDAVRRLA